MKKKILALSLCAAASTSLLSGVTAFASTPGQKTIPVEYDSRLSIPDPDSPAGAEKYQVLIPSAVSFTEVGAPVDMTVEIVDGQDKSKPYEGTDTINVTLASDKEYKVDMEGQDKLDYEVVYGSHKNDGIVGALNKTTNKIEGTATLKDKAQKSGIHTDELTFTIEKQA